jgi:hypothetical protein
VDDAEAYPAEFSILMPSSHSRTIAPICQTRRCRAAFLLACGMLLAATGCSWWLRITEVAGSVTVDGKPAAGVQLVFDPLDRSRPRAFATTDAAGRFRLGRQGPGDKSGAAAGRYVVRVMSDNDGGDGIVIPPAYNVRSTLEFEVVPGQANVFEIDVSTKLASP